MTNYFIDILEITIPISALILILAAFSPLIKKKLIAKWRYFMWLFIALRITLPFKFAADKAMIELPDITQGTAAGVSSNAPVYNTQHIFLLIYWSGVILFFTIRILCCADFFSMIKRWQRSADDKIIETAKTVKKELNIRRGLRIVTCKAVSSPMMTGLFREKLILPERQFSANELDIILRHELIHMKNRDIFYKSVLTVANALNWFNPTVYLMARMANRDIELVCDSAVINGRDTEYRRLYGQTILNVASNRFGAYPPLSTCFAVSKSAIKERLEGIFSLRPKKRGIILFLVVACSVAATSSVISFAKDAVKDEFEEKLEFVVRTTPEPTTAAVPEPSADSYESSESKAYAPVSSYRGETSAPTVRSADQGHYTDTSETTDTDSLALGIPDALKDSQSHTLNIAEQPQNSTSNTAADTSTAKWWNDDMTVSRDTADADQYTNISDGKAGGLNVSFDNTDSVTAGGVYYVEPNESMSVYHSGGKIEIADAETGALITDNGSDESSNVSVVTAGNEGSYYKVNISKSAEDEDGAKVYIISK